MSEEVKQGLHSSDPRFMTSLARGLAVLRAFEGHPALTVSQLAKLTGLSRSATTRCLFTLEQLGYIDAHGTKYSLTPGVLPLARAFTSGDPLTKAAQPALDTLRDRLGDSSSLAMFDSRRAPRCVVYVCRAEAARIISLPLLIGSTLPSYCTSNGRVLLASLSPQALADYLAEAPFPTRTARTLVTADALHAEIARVRAQGWSMTDGELEGGLRSISVPVTGGRRAAALNLATQSAHRSLHWLMEVALPELQAAAAHISRLSAP